MLTIKELSKSYGRNEVLKNIDLNIEDNKIYGLFGRNGVGKTTLLNLIAGQIRRNCGEIKLDGEDVFENPQAMEEISLSKTFPEAIKEKKVKDLLKVAGILYKDWDEEYKNDLLKEFDLNPKKKLSKLSTGNKTIVSLIIGLASRSRITIFDEPTLGLDAALRNKFYDLLLEDYENYPRTILIATHLIDEVSNLFERIIIIKDKSIALDSDVNELQERAYFLSGQEEVINPIIGDKRVIHRESFGSRKIVGLYGELTKDEIRNINENKIELSKIPLQKLFIYLTEATGEGGSMNGFN